MRQDSWMGLVKGEMEGKVARRVYVAGSGGAPVASCCLQNRRFSVFRLHLQHAQPDKLNQGERAVRACVRAA